MRRFQILAISFGLIGVFGAAWVSPASAAKHGSTVPRSSAASAPVDVRLPAVDGPDFATRAHRGAVVVLNFWGLWCEPCKEEMPHLAALQTEFAERGLVVAVANTDGAEFRDRIVAYLRSVHPAFAPLIDENGAVCAQFAGMPTTPFTMILDRDGRVTWSHTGFDTTTPARMRAEVEKALARPVSGR